MDEYDGVYEEQFVCNLMRYSSMRKRIRKKVELILDDPYDRTEYLGRVSGGLDLRGCRSARVSRNFRVIFVICEECRNVKGCQYCFCEDRADETVVFLTVGPHDRSYMMK